MPNVLQQTTKKELRKQYREIRDKVSGSVRHHESINVCEQLINSSFYQEADAVFCYLSFGSEFETDRLIRKALSDGKTVAVPVIKGTEMIFCRICHDTEYRLNGYGIPEPVAEVLTEPCSFFTSLIILPGLCYDNRCGRIGYGGGYYDRYIARYGKTSKVHTVSLALSCQVYDGCIPMEEHDVRPDKIFLPTNESKIF